NAAAARQERVRQRGAAVILQRAQVWTGEDVRAADGAVRRSRNDILSQCRNDVVALGVQRAPTVLGYGDGMANKVIDVDVVGKDAVLEVDVATEVVDTAPITAACYFGIGNVADNSRIE